MDAASTSPGPRVAVTSVLGFLACVGILVGWFLPWFSLSAQGRKETSFLTRRDAERMEAQLRSKGETDRAVAALKRLLEDKPLDGRDWTAVADSQLRNAEPGDITPENRRVFEAILVVLVALPWLAAAVGILIAFGRFRPMPSPVLALLFTMGCVVAGLGGLLVAGASEAARKEATSNFDVLGLGIQVVAISGVAAMLFALFGMRRSNWGRTLFLCLLGLGAVIAAFVRHVNS